MANTSKIKRTHQRPPSTHLTSNQRCKSWCSSRVRVRTKSTLVFCLSGWCSVCEFTCYRSHERTNERSETFCVAGIAATGYWAGGPVHGVHGADAPSIRASPLFTPLLHLSSPDVPD